MKKRLGRSDGKKKKTSGRKLFPGGGAIKGIA